VGGKICYRAAGGEEMEQLHGWLVRVAGHTIANEQGLQHHDRDKDPKEGREID
jgi:hypothetical protein